MRLQVYAHAFAAGVHDNDMVSEILSFASIKIATISIYLLMINKLFRPLAYQLFFLDCTTTSKVFFWILEDFVYT